MILKDLTIEAEGYKAKLQVLLWDNSQELHTDRPRPIILVCPGGGYGMTSDREADAIAFQFMAMGYHTAVLRYSVAPARYPVALLQAAGAVKLFRENAEEWWIDSDKIIVAGFSAGGHLACSLGVFWNREVISGYYKCDPAMFRVNGMILGYPVITSGEFAHEGSFRSLLGERYEDMKDEMSLEKQVSKNTPPAFIWHTQEDDCVPVENSMLFYAALHRQGIPAEYHIFQKGGHGLGLANEITMNREGYGIQRECQSWISLAHEWIESNFVR